MRPTDVPDTGKQVLTLNFLLSGSKLCIPLDNITSLHPNSSLIPETRLLIHFCTY